MIYYRCEVIEKNTSFGYLLCRLVHWFISPRLFGVGMAIWVFYIQYYFVRNFLRVIAILR